MQRHSSLYRSSLFRWAAGAALLLGVALPASAQTTYHFTLDSTPLDGVAANLAFSLVGSDDSSNNSATFENASTDGAFGGVILPEGGTSGDLSGTLILNDADFFNRAFQKMTLGTGLSFDLTLTSNYDNSIDPFAFPDQIASFTIDGPITDYLIHTDDPTGNNALFTYEFNGQPGGNLTVYNSLTQGVTWTMDLVPANVTPEPGSLSLMASGLLGLGLVRRRRKPRTAGA